MEELAAKWQDLTDIQQASITELIAGKRQGNIVSSLMTNFDIAQNALQTSLGSEGSAMKEHAKAMESIELKLNALKAAWQAFSQTFMNSDLLKGGIDGLRTFVEILEKLVDNFGLLGTIGLGTLGTGIFKYFTNFKKNFDGIADVVDTVTDVVDTVDDAVETLDNVGDAASNISGAVADATGAMTNLGGATSKTTGVFKAFMKTPLGVASAIGVAVAAIGLIINAYKNYKEEISEARQETIRTSDDFLDASNSFEQAYIKYSGKTNLTAEEEAELESAIKGTVDALDDKSNKLHDVVNSSNDYVASLERIADAELKASATAAKNKRDNAELELKDLVKGWTDLESEVGINISSSKAEAPAAEILSNMNSKFDIGLGDSRYNHTMYSGRINIDTNANASEIVEYYNFLLDYQEKLSDAELIDTAAYSDVTVVIEKLSEAVGIYTDGLYDLAKAEYQARNGIPKTTEAYLEMREAILTREDIARTGLDTKMSILNSLDSEYANIFDLSSAEAQARKFVGIIKGFGDGTKDGTNEIGTVETFLNMRTAVNNNDCSVGEYLSELDNITSMSEKFSDEEEKEFNLAFGLDTDAVKKQYKDVYKYISREYLDNIYKEDVGVSGFGAMANAPGNHPSNINATADYTEKEWKKLREARKNRATEEKRIENILKGLNLTELQAVANIKAEIDWSNATTDEILNKIQKEADLIEALSFSADIEIDKTSLEALNTALQESASAIGLSKESIDSLKSKYSELEGYNPHTLFEKTANGVKLNREEVAKLEKKYNDLKKTEVQKHLDTLVEEYNKCTKAIDGNIGSNEKLELISKREKYAEQIEELAEYQSQLEGVTGAYQRWIDAQNTPEDYEGYQAVATSRKGVKDEISRGFISNSTKEYIDLLSGEDLVGGTIDDYAEAWDRLDKKVGSTSYSIHDFFTVNDDGDITAKGIDRFFDGIKKDFKGEVYKFNDDTQEWYYDFSADNLKKIQDEWGIGIEAIELLLEAAASAGYDIDWGGIFDDLDIDISNFESVEAMISLAEKAQEEFNKIKNLDDVEFNFRTNNIQDATAEVEKARKAYVDLITNDDGSINLKAEGAEQMQFMLATLLTQKQQLSTPAIMKVDTSQIDQAKTDVIDVINKAKELQTAYENYEIAITTGVDVDGAKKDLNSAIEGMKGTSVDVRADLKLPTDEELQTAKDSIGDIKVGATLDGTAIGNLTTKIQTECTPEVIAKVTGLDESAVASEPHQVVYTAEHKDVDNFINSLSDISKKIIYSYTTEGTKPDPSNINRKITYTYEIEGEGPGGASGTAFANGTTSGRAFARGDWGIKGNGTALGGELGQELVVRDGKFFTIGDEGAQFFKYRPNDIIFNAAQTESLFKYGGIKGAKPRGKMLATGSAFAEGNYPSSGEAFWRASVLTSDFALAKLKDGSTKKKKKSTTKKNTKDSDVSITENNINVNVKASESDTTKKRKESTGSSKKSSSSSKSKSSSSSSSEKEFEESFDWIEIAISRIERAIDKLGQKANNIYKSWSSRNKALTEEIEKVREEIELQDDAANRYLQEANSVGLSSSWAEKVRNGEIDLSTIKDEDLAEKIGQYRDWYEKYLDCIDAAEELKQKESELYAQRFENVQTQYDGILQGYEHTEAMLNEYIAQSEAKGHIISKKYYTNLIANEKQNINTLKQEQMDLIKSRDEAVASGKIAKYSEEW